MFQPFRLFFSIDLDEVSLIWIEMGFIVKPQFAGIIIYLKFIWLVSRKSLFFIKSISIIKDPIYLLPKLICSPTYKFILQFRGESFYYKKLI